MENGCMSRLRIICVCIFVAMISAARAGTYTLTDGNQVSGEPIFNDQGVKFKDESGAFTPDRTPYEKFTQEAIRQLLADAKGKDKRFLEPFVEEMPQEKAKKKEIIIKPVPSPERPTKDIGIFKIFKSPVGLVILLILYAATLFAAFEVAVFRNQPFGLVIGLAAVPFLGVLSPIIFIAMPTRTLSLEEFQEAHAAPVEGGEAMPAESGVTESDPLAGTGEHGKLSISHGGAPAAEAAAPALPEPIIFRRGEFSFNRRFFETKLAGFFRLVPGEAEKDMVVRIKSSRGEFTGRRIIKITQDELYLQTFNGQATADEMIPIIEVMEVQIRHKDLP